jgi:GNAT superfamily N-acetyltransferase
MEIRRIAYQQGLFAPMLAEAEAGDGPFLLRLRDDWLSGALRFEDPDELLLGAFRGGRLVGVGGISRDPYAPQPGLGRVRHVYVLRACRGQGIARMLMERLLSHALGRFDRLRLSTRRPEAARLYENLGFGALAGEKQTHLLDPVAGGEGRG